MRSAGKNLPVQFALVLKIICMKANRHSDQCDIREGRTKEQKEAMAREITRVVHETIGSPVEYIYVLIRETPGSHHVKGGMSRLNSFRKIFSPGGNS